MKTLGTLLLGLLLSIGTLANENMDRANFDIANNLYEEGSFENASKLYEGLLLKGFISDDLHYNLANCYFKQNEIAPAILHYEKAIKINPSNEDAAHNLALANEKTIDKVEAIPELFFYRWWKAIFNFMSADAWAKLTVTLFIISVAGFLLYLLGNSISQRKAAFYTFSFAIGLGLITWFMAFQQQHYLESSNHAIIMNPTVNINSSPSEGSSQLFVLHEGTKVKIKDETEKWLEVALPNGNVGWVMKSEVAEV